MRKIIEIISIIMCLNIFLVGCGNNKTNTISEDNSVVVFSEKDKVSEEELSPTITVKNNVFTGDTFTFEYPFEYSEHEIKIGEKTTKVIAFSNSSWITASGITRKDEAYQNLDADTLKNIIDQVSKASFSVPADEIEEFKEFNDTYKIATLKYHGAEDIKDDEMVLYLLYSPDDGCVFALMASNPEPYQEQINIVLNSFNHKNIEEKETENINSEINLDSEKDNSNDTQEIDSPIKEESQK